MIKPDDMKIGNGIRTSERVNTKHKTASQQNLTFQIKLQLVFLFLFEFTLNVSMFALVHEQTFHFFLLLQKKKTNNASSAIVYSAYVSKYNKHYRHESFFCFGFHGIVLPWQPTAFA